MGHHVLSEQETLEQNESQAMTQGLEAGWEGYVKICIKISFLKNMCPLQSNNPISRGLS